MRIHRIMVDSIKRAIDFRQSATWQVVTGAPDGELIHLWLFRCIDCAAPLLPSFIVLFDFTMCCSCPATTFFSIGG